VGVLHPRDALLATNRGAHSSLCRPEPVRCHDAFRGTEHHLHVDRATDEAYCIAHHHTVDGEMRRLMVAYLRYFDITISLRT
jgi:hypothetical protein